MKSRIRVLKAPTSGRSSSVHGNEMTCDVNGNRSATLNKFYNRERKHVAGRRDYSKGTTFLQIISDGGGRAGGKGYIPRACFERRNGMICMCAHSTHRHRRREIRRREEQRINQTATQSYLSLPRSSLITHCRTHLVDTRGSRTKLRTKH